MTRKNAEANRLRDDIRAKRKELVMLRRRRSSCEEVRASREWVRVTKRMSALEVDIKHLEKELWICGL